MPASDPFADEPDLPFIAYCELVRQLRHSMPDPEDATPEALLNRDRAAIQQISTLVPASTSEVSLAVDFVSAEAWARHCLNNARQLAHDLEAQRKQLAMASSMMRQAQGFHARLQRAQAGRVKREASNAGQADWTEHCVLNTLRQAMGDQPAAPLQIEAADEFPPDEALAEAPTGAPAAEPDEADESAPDLPAEAERYAIIYPRRARAIRHYGGLPPDCDFGPPEPELIAAIVAGATPALRALDQTPQAG